MNGSEYSNSGRARSSILYDLNDIQYGNNNSNNKSNSNNNSSSNNDNCYSNDNNNNTNNSSSSSASNSTTIVKYEKSSCLFCNDWFDAQTFTEHLIHCGQVLEQCPNTCNAFVPRIRMRNHLKECPRAKQRLSSSHSMDRLDQNQLDHHRLQVIEHDIGALRSVLNEEIRQRLHLITDVGNLRKQNQITDEWTQRTDSKLDNFRQRLDEENTQRCYEVEQCQNDFRYCYDITQSLKTELQTEMDALQKHINQVSLQVAGHQNHLNDNIMKLEEAVLENEKVNRDKFIEIEDFLSVVSADLKTSFSPNTDLKAKLETIDLEVKGMKNIVCETEERCDKLEAMFSRMDHLLHQTMQRVADLENHIATQQRLTSIQNTRGHLIWRIKDFTKQLEEAKQYDTILHSAMFSNKQFGYALRLDIHLNGKGTWKGRNMIACLNVIAGEFDPLLAWPCRLQADVIIRDQSNSSTAAAQDYVKTVVVRKKSDDLIQSNQYFHIPHKTIMTGNFLKNDCIFIEVRVLK